MGKAVCLATQFDAEEVCGVCQLYAGTIAGIEGVVNALNELFEENCSCEWGVLLIGVVNDLTP